MRAAMPFILVILGLFTAACIAYIAWELTSDKKDHGATDRERPEQDEP